MFPRDKQEPVSLADAPELILEPISNYISNLPGYDRSKKGKQGSQVLEQHGFITMQLTRVFGQLADTYSHIIRTNLPEVDLKDVVLNRRVLVVLLPALEKSPDELAALGKVIISSLKAMMAAGLGDAVEGTYREVISRKPTNAPTPYMCILDEYGYYAVKGFAVVPAQARSLGFSVIFAGQDLPAFQKASKEEAASIGANTNIKICMKLEDPMETWEFFQKTAGESYVTKVDSFQTNAGSLLNNYMDSRSASSEKRQRVDLLDLKDQREGEAHIFFKSKIIRATMFFASPKQTDKMRLNQFLKVEPPLNRLLVDLDERVIRLHEVLQSTEQLFTAVQDEGDDIQVVAEAINAAADVNPIERALNALMSYHNRNAVPETVEEPVAEIEDGRLNIFSQVCLNDFVQNLVGRNQIATFQQPLLDRNYIRDKVAFIERLLGRSPSQAGPMAGEVVKDLALATDYPPAYEHIMLPSEQVVTLANQLCDYVTSLNGNAQT